VLDQPDIMKQAVLECRDGISISDARKPDNPIVFVNSAFERMTGYKAKEVLGINCRFLQGVDRDQPGLEQLRLAIREGKSCLVTLRNYRQDGSQFWNELSISPIHNPDGELTHFLGIQKDVSQRFVLEELLRQRNVDLEASNNELLRLATTDPLTSLYNRRYFDRQLSIHWSLAARNHDHIALFMIDVDHFKLFNDQFGHPEGDRCLQAVAGAISGNFKRVSDVVARYGGEEFIVLAPGLAPAMARQFAEQIRQDIAALTIANPKSPTANHVTACVGFGSIVPEQGYDYSQMIDNVDDALYNAKSSGRNRCSEATALTTAE